MPDPTPVPMDRQALRSLARRLEEPGYLPSRGLTQALLSDRDHQEALACALRKDAQAHFAEGSRARRRRGRLEVGALASRYVVGMSILVATLTSYEGLLDLAAFGVGALLLCGPTCAPAGDDA